jgi:hypothetical protein
MYGYTHMGMILLAWIGTCMDDTPGLCIGMLG